MLIQPLVMRTKFCETVKSDIKNSSGDSEYFILSELNALLCC